MQRHQPNERQWQLDELGLVARVNAFAIQLEAMAACAVERRIA
jgi:hypothetical protein